MNSDDINSDPLTHRRAIARLIAFTGMDYISVVTCVLLDALAFVFVFYNSRYMHSCAYS